MLTKPVTFKNIIFLKYVIYKKKTELIQNAFFFNYRTKLVAFWMTNKNVYFLNRIQSFGDLKIIL